jgi:Flp pilus assembly protein TadG
MIPERKGSQRTRARQRGVAILEFVITLPLLMMLILATAEIGRALFQYNTLTKALRDSARYVSGARPGSTGVFNLTPEIRAAAQRLVVYGNATGAGSALLPDLAPSDVTIVASGAGYITVSAVYNFTPMLGAQLETFGVVDPIQLAFPMRAAVVMRVL